MEKEKDRLVEVVAKIRATEPSLDAIAQYHERIKELRERIRSANVQG
jgi:hypothetical protein